MCAQVSCGTKEKGPSSGEEQARGITELTRRIQERAKRGKRAEKKGQATATHETRSSHLRRILLEQRENLKNAQASRENHLKRILAGQQGKAQLVFDRLVNAGQDRQRLIRLLTRSIPADEKPLAGSLRKNYDKRLETVESHLWAVSKDLSPVVRSKDYVDEEQCVDEEKRIEREQHIERLREVRMIATEIGCDSLTLATACRELACAIKHYRKSIPKDRLSPRDWLWVELLDRLAQGAESPPFRDAATLANAMLAASGEHAAITEGKLKMLFTRQAKIPPRRKK